MKSFVVVVLAFCVAGALAGLTDEQKAKLKEHRAACVAETGASDDVIDKLEKGEPVEIDENSDEKLNCFAACMLKKVGIMKDDGSIDEQVARDKLPKDLPQDKVDAVINMCTVQIGKDACETGGKVMECLAKTQAVELLH